MNTSSAKRQAISSFGVEDLPRMAYGRGSYVFDRTGKRYLDGSGGPAVYSVGHANEEVNAAIKAQLDEIAHAYRYVFTSDASDALQEIVLRQTGGGFHKVIFVSSGSEAVEFLPEDCAAVLVGARAARQAPLHLAQALLAWQHAWRAFGFAFQVAARRLRGQPSRRVLRLGSQ